MAASRSRGGPSLNTCRMTWRTSVRHCSAWGTFGEQADHIVLPEIVEHIPTIYPLGIWSHSQAAGAAEPSFLMRHQVGAASDVTTATINNGSHLHSVPA